MQFPPKSVFPLGQVERFLVPASLVYLALPYVIFYVGWLRWYWALLGVGLLAIGLIEFTRLAAGAASESKIDNGSQQAIANDAQAEPVPVPVLPLRHLLLLLLISFAWLSLAGVGGLGYQRGDWMKHESIVKDLIESSWPAIYDFYAAPVPLVYYLAYYLPAALVGKVGGWGAAQFTLFVWTYAGLNLAILWFWLLVHKAATKVAGTVVGKLSAWFFLIFVFFSGLDVIGKIIVIVAGWSANDWSRVERWGLGFEYSANTVLLYWVPNQALAGWLAGALTLYAILYVRHKRISWLPVGLSVLGAPFVTLGLGPYLLVEFLSDQGSWGARLRRYLSWSNLCALSLLLFVGLYYLSKFYEASPFASSSMPHSFFVSGDPAMRVREYSLLVLFWLVEVGIYAFLIRKSVRSESRLWRWLFVTTLIFLALLPLYKVGIHNDLVMRASIPALFCLVVLIGRALYRNALGLSTRMALLVALVLGVGTSIGEFSYNVSGIYREMMGMPRDEVLETRGIIELYQGMPDYFVQYIGAYESPFFQYFAKEQAWVSASQEKRFISFLDNKILFEGYDLEKGSALQAGDHVQLVSRVHVFFGDVYKNYNISLRLVAEDGREVWREQGWPENRPTSIWAPTVVWHDTRTLTIPADTPAGFYRLELSFVDPDTHDLLPAVAVPGGDYLGEMVPVGYVTVGKVESEPAYPLPQVAHLDDQVALLGLDAAPAQEVARGDTLQLALFWQALGEMERDYTGFVHLLDEKGKLVAQNDHPPRNGFLPTSLWREGLTIADPYTLLMPQEVSPGAYTLVAGMYDLESGVRLPVRQEGEEVGDVVVLAHLDVR